MEHRTFASIANLFFGFFPVRLDSGNPQLDLENFYSRF